MNYPARYQHLLDEHGVILDQLGLADVALELRMRLKLSRFFEKNV
jgi:hypothetical protein